VLKLIFNVLYDEDVITEQTFLKWEKEDNPDEMEGKGVATLSVASFLAWLREPDSDE